MQRIVKDVLLIAARICLFDRFIAVPQDADVLAYMTYVEMAGLDTIVEVGGEVGDLIGEVDDLGFERRALVEEVWSEFRVVSDPIVARVLDDSFPRAKCQIEAAMTCIPLLEAFHNPECVQVVIEAKTVRLQATVQSAFASVPKGRMADIVNQGECLHEIDVQAERGGDLTRYLGDLNGMSEPAPEVIGGAAGEDLGLSSETPKRS